MPKFPPIPGRPPRLSDLLRQRNPARELREAVKDARDLIGGVRDGIRSVADEIRVEPLESPPEGSSQAREPYQGVSEGETFDYQIDQLVDDLQHLTEHLSNQGRLAGKPCDCIAKAARDARRHATETISIASRQGKPPRIFAEIAAWAERLIPIGTLEAASSGQYDDVYLEESGTASRFRKEVEKLKGECETCPSMLDLKEFLERRRKGQL